MKSRQHQAKDPKKGTVPCALAIGGLDPGGGAGIAADLRAFHAAGVFGCAALTLTTVQSTQGLRSISVLPARETFAMCKEVLRVQTVRAIKTGALGSDAQLRTVVALLQEHPELPVVVDPVMGATRGRVALLAASSLGRARRSLVSRATVLTPNVPEAEALLGRRIRTLEQAEAAAKELVEMGAKAVLLKGGHMQGKEAIDVFATTHEIVLLRSPRYDLGGELHGGGCTLASLIAGRLALGETSLAAARWAKARVAPAIRARTHVGGKLRVVVA